MVSRRVRQQQIVRPAGPLDEHLPAVDLEPAMALPASGSPPPRGCRSGPTRASETCESTTNRSSNAYNSGVPRSCGHQRRGLVMRSCGYSSAVKVTVLVSRGCRCTSWRKWIPSMRPSRMPRDSLIAVIHQVGGDRQIAPRRAYRGSARSARTDSRWTRRRRSAAAPAGRGPCCGPGPADSSPRSRS